MFYTIYDTKDQDYLPNWQEINSIKRETFLEISNYIRTTKSEKGFNLGNTPQGKPIIVSSLIEAITYFTLLEKEQNKGKKSSSNKRH